MKRADWRAIREQIGRGSPRGEMTPAGAFWDDFRARARLHPQHEPETRVLPVVLRWGLATACAALAVMAAAYVLTPGSSAGLAEVKSVRVMAPHSAVLIMDNERAQSTILWISGMTAEKTQGEGG
jgi:hypothetical protein